MPGPHCRRTLCGRRGIKLKQSKNFCPTFCSTCGGTLTYSADGLEATCPYCGNKYNFRGGKSEALMLALSRANAMRASCDFDEAMREYSLITERNPEDGEAWWGLTLSKYGIEYIADERTGMRVPTCHRTVEGSILEDECYKNALKYSSPEQAESYRRKAEQIERLQAAIKARLAEEESFDVFLCFRSADKNGAPTRERIVARRIYDELSRRGIRTFFSEVTLKNRLGEDFEPIIYKALNTCKFFILIACSEENVNAPWVKNEWSRFRDRVYEERLSAACCAVFENITLAQLPSFLRGQGVDLAKYPAGGYEIEIADNLQLRFSGGASGAPSANGAGMAGMAAGISGMAAAADINGELERGRRELAEGDFVSAAASFSRAIDKDGDCGEAWLGAFMAEIEVRQIKTQRKFSQEVCNRLWASGTTVQECDRRLASNEHITYAFASPYYKNAVKYSTPAMARILAGAKAEVMDMADKCNASLRLCRDDCLERQRAAAEGYGQYDTGEDGRSSAADAAAAIAGGAIAGGIMGLIFGGARRRPREPRFFSPPHFRPGPPRPPRPGGHFGGRFGGRGWRGRR